jgi:hypothetical protein
MPPSSVMHFITRLADIAFASVVGAGVIAGAGGGAGVVVAALIVAPRLRLSPRGLSWWSNGPIAFGPRFHGGNGLMGACVIAIAGGGAGGGAEGGAGLFP